MEDKIKCNNCGKETGLFRSDFNEDKDFSDVYCSDDCRYNFETGHSGEEY
jgi:hypothetical protein